MKLHSTLDVALTTDVEIAQAAMVVATVFGGASKLTGDFHRFTENEAAIVA